MGGGAMKTVQNQTGANDFWKGLSGKFAESLGSGLALGIVTIVGLAILKNWILTGDAIVDFTPYVNTWRADSAGNNCIVTAHCLDGSIAIAGDCTIINSNPQSGEFHLQNFGVLNT